MCLGLRCGDHVEFHAQLGPLLAEAVIFPQRDAADTLCPHVAQAFAAVIGRYSVGPLLELLRISLRKIA